MVKEDVKHFLVEGVNAENVVNATGLRHHFRHCQLKTQNRVPRAVERTIQLHPYVSQMLSCNLGP